MKPWLVAVFATGVFFSGAAAATAQSAGQSVAQSAEHYVPAGWPEAGAMLISVGAGAVVLFPHAELGLRVGVGKGAGLDVLYRNYAILGHGGEVRLGYNRPVRVELASGHLALGGRLRTAINTQIWADGIFGIEFSSVPLGNDWEIGGDVVAVWARPGRADITAQLGTTWTLGGVRYLTYDTRSFQIDPGWRSIDFTVQGQWRWTARRDIFFRLHGTVLTRGETRPIGFLPTGLAGFVWRLR